MSDRIYLYSNKNLLNLIKQILLEYTVLPLTIDEINSNNFKNNNALIVGKSNLIKEINQSFFLSNNVICFLSNKEADSIIKKKHNTKFFYDQHNIKKFIDEIKAHLLLKKIVMKNIEIFGEKITNLTLGKSQFLTPTEKEILIVLFENKILKKEFFLENILKIKKNIETKTIESHLTRIRGKLLKIESNLQITTKEDSFYLEF